MFTKLEAWQTQFDSTQYNDAQPNRVRLVQKRAMVCKIHANRPQLNGYAFRFRLV
jgi:hypothetical protein